MSSKHENSGEPSEEPASSGDPFDFIKHGSYYIFPDSAPPLPDRIWENIDPDGVERAVREVQQDAVEDLTPDERSRAEVLARGVYYTPTSQRNALLAIGSSAIDAALDYLDDLDARR